MTDEISKLQPDPDRQYSGGKRKRAIKREKAPKDQLSRDADQFCPERSLPDDPQEYSSDPNFKCMLRKHLNRPPKPKY